MNLRLGYASLSLLALMALAVASGCLAPQARESRLAQPGALTDRYALSTGHARSAAGCRYAYRIYDPRSGDKASTNSNAERGPTVVTTVMLGHGFLRNQNTLVELARALANAGFRAVTLDFCNMRPWNGHHARNAQDLVDLATQVNARPVIYAGFSAGALAAVLAAASDPTTTAVLTLDLVDQGDLAIDALETLNVPIVGLQGPPSSCNADGSGQRVFDTRPDASLQTLPSASHCEFESPTNRWCEIACGDDDPEGNDDKLRADIIRRVVMSVSELAESRPTAAADVASFAVSL